MRFHEFGRRIRNARAARLKEEGRWADISSVVVAEAGWRGRHPPGPHRSFLAGLWDGVNALRVYPIVAYRVDHEAFRTPRSWIILDLFCCDLTKRRTADSCVLLEM